MRQFVSTIVLLVWLTASAEAASWTMPLDTEINPPEGHQAFCQTYPKMCRERDPQPRLIKYEGELWWQLVDINAWFNNHIKPVSDLEHYGVEEYWSFPDDQLGDCEDYVLAKYRYMVAKGVSESLLLLTRVYDEHNEGHLVLTVRTTAGDFIFDNKTDVVLHWTETSFRSYDRRQSVGNGAKWVTIKNTR